MLHAHTVTRASQRRRVLRTRPPGTPCFFMFSWGVANYCTHSLRARGLQWLSLRVYNCFRHYWGFAMAVCRPRLVPCKAFSSSVASLFVGVELVTCLLTIVFLLQFLELCLGVVESTTMQRSLGCVPGASDSRRRGLILARSTNRDRAIIRLPRPFPAPRQ